MVVLGKDVLVLIVRAYRLYILYLLSHNDSRWSQFDSLRSLAADPAQPRTRIVAVTGPHQLAAQDSEAAEMKQKMALKIGSINIR